MNNIAVRWTVYLWLLSLPAEASQSWDLTEVGDWRQTNIDGVVQNRDHNPVHEVTQLNGSLLTYDAKGNLSRDHAGMALSWDEESRLRTAVPASG